MCATIAPGNKPKINAINLQQPLVISSQRKSVTAMTTYHPTFLTVGCFLRHNPVSAVAQTGEPVANVGTNEARTINLVSLTLFHLPFWEHKNHKLMDEVCSPSVLVFFPVCDFPASNGSRVCCDSCNVLIC